MALLLPRVGKGALLVPRPPQQILPHLPHLGPVRAVRPARYFPSIPLSSLHCDRRGAFLRRSHPWLPTWLDGLLQGLTRVEAPVALVAQEWAPAWDGQWTVARVAIHILHLQRRVRQGGRYKLGFAG